MRLSWLACAVLIVATQGASAQAASGDAAQRFVGRYVFAGPRHAEMEVRIERGRYVVMLEGGADPSAGPASPADCSIRAVGKENAHQFVGHFAQVESDTFSYSERRARAEQRVLEIHFGDRTAEVTRADVTGYCGWGADFIGVYRREQ